MLRLKSINNFNNDLNKILMFNTNINKEKINKNENSTSSSVYEYKIKEKNKLISSLKKKKYDFNKSEEIDLREINDNLDNLIIEINKIKENLICNLMK